MCSSQACRPARVRRRAATLRDGQPRHGWRGGRSDGGGRGRRAGGRRSRVLRLGLAGYVAVRESCVMVLDSLALHRRDATHARVSEGGSLPLRCAERPRVGAKLTQRGVSCSNSCDRARQKGGGARAGGDRGGAGGGRRRRRCGERGLWGGVRRAGGCRGVGHVASRRVFLRIVFFGFRCFVPDEICFKGLTGRPVIFEHILLGVLRKAGQRGRGGC